MVDNYTLTLVVIVINQTLLILVLLYAYLYFVKKRKLEIHLDKEKPKAVELVKETPKKVSPPPKAKVETFPQISKKMHRDIFHQEMDTLHKKIEVKKKEQPHKVKMLKAEKKYEPKLKAVEAELYELSPEAVQKIRDKEEYCKHLRPGYLAQMDIDHELRKIRCLLDKSEAAPETFLGKIKKKFSPEKDEAVEQAATEMVRKISHQIERNHPIPPNELIWVQEELKKLRQEINSRD